MNWRGSFIPLMGLSVLVVLLGEAPISFAVAAVGVGTAMFDFMRSRR